MFSPVLRCRRVPESAACGPMSGVALALGHSRLSFVQLYPRFTRFECKLFLDDALDYVDGVFEICMVGNTSVIVLRVLGSATQE
jgi:hypothetical protein